MRLRTTLASVAATTAIAGGTIALAVPPASASTTRGTTGCFSYSYDNGGSQSVTVYYHNRCATTHHVKIRLKYARDKCYAVKGHAKDSQFYDAGYPAIKVQQVKAVSSC